MTILVETHRRIFIVLNFSGESLKFFCPNESINDTENGEIKQLHTYLILDDQVH